MITLIEIHLFFNWIYLRKNVELTGALVEEQLIDFKAETIS